MGWIGGARFIDCAASGGLERADNLEVRATWAVGHADFHSGGQYAFGFESPQGAAGEIFGGPLPG